MTEQLLIFAFVLGIMIGGAAFTLIGQAARGPERWFQDKANEEGDE